MMDKIGTLMNQQFGYGLEKDRKAGKKKADNKPADMVKNGPGKKDVDKAKENKEIKDTLQISKSANDDVKLSDAAKKLLEELKEKYGNMDFFVAKTSSDEEAQRYMSQGTKDYSVLIDPDLLEEMAKDDAVKEKYMGIIEDATGQLDEALEQMSDEEKESVKNIGISIDREGNVSFFAEMEKAGKVYKERLEKQREAKKEEAAQKEKLEKRRAAAEKYQSFIPGNDMNKKANEKSDFLHADSMEELLEMIRNYGKGGEGLKVAVNSEESGNQQENMSL